MDEKLEIISCQIIGAAGSAKSCYVEAIQAAKNKKFQEADDLMKKGSEMYVECHKAHAELLTLSANEAINMTLLLTHAEDQMMNCETAQIVAKEMIELYRMIEELRGEKNVETER